MQDPWKGSVVPSLWPALEWLRQYTRSSPRGVHVQVLVTGSLYLVGDVLRLLGRAPK
jgi:folylpolyglutamate synthase